MNKQETLATLEATTVPNLLLAADKDGIEVPAKGKAKIIEAMVAHYFPAPSDEAVTEAVENSKAAKNPELPHRVKLAKVYDSFRSILPDGEETVNMEGLEASFWRARPEAADFGGVTLRFDNSKNPTGANRAIIGNIRKAFKQCGIPCDTIVIRKAGASTFYV